MSETFGPVDRHPSEGSAGGDTATRRVPSARRRVGEVSDGMDEAIVLCTLRVRRPVDSECDLRMLSTSIATQSIRLLPAGIRAIDPLPTGSVLTVDRTLADGTPPARPNEGARPTLHSEAVDGGTIERPRDPRDRSGPIDRFTSRCNHLPARVRRAAVEVRFVRFHASMMRTGVCHGCLRPGLPEWSMRP